MPRLNSRWEYAMGIAGIQGSVLGEIIPDAYGPYWYNDNYIFFPQVSDDKFYIMDVVSKIRTKVSESPGNTYRANGGNWATWSNGSGVITGAGTPGLGLSGLLDVGPDGAVGIIPNYQQGVGCDVIEKNGERWTLSTGIVYDLQLLGNKCAIWRDETFKIHTYGLPPCVQVGNCYKPKAVFCEGQWWVSYWSTTKGLVLHPFNSTVGYVINTSDSFGNVAGASDPYINVGWSTHEGEWPDEYRYKLTDVLTEPRQELGNSIPVPVPEGNVMIPAFERPMWMAPFFSYHTRYGDTAPDKYTGNSIIQLADDTNQNRFPELNKPLIVDVNCPSFDPNLTVAFYASGGNITELNNSVNAGLLKGDKPIIAYLDGRNWPTANPFNSDRVWPAIQCYRLINESLAQFTDAVENVILCVRDYNLPIVLVTRFDDFNGSSTIERTLECMPLYEAWIRAYAVVGHMPFADRRGNGIANNPSLWNWARAFQYAIPFERPNRYDYWKPAGLSNKQILENKFGQTRASVVIEPYLRTDILSKYSAPTPPNPQPGEWPNLLPLLEAERTHYGTLMNADQCVEMINNVAKKAGNGWGLLRKQGGNHGVQPGTGIFCSVDWLVNNQIHKGTDCLIDGGDSTANYSGKATPSWPSDGQPYDGSNFVEPV